MTIPSSADTHVRPKQGDENFPALGAKITFRDQGESRVFYITRPETVPKTRSLPTILCFHGGGGNLKGLLSMVESLRKAGFQVLTPVGLNGHWNDGRVTTKHAEQDKRIDDVAFIERILTRTEGIDRSRVYAFGVSNGGMFTHRLAIQEPELFAAVAAIAAPLPVAAFEWDTNETSTPLPILLMMGNQDPWLPFSGGKVVANMAPRLLRNDRDWGQGEVQSFSKTVEFWRKKNGLNMTPVAENAIEDVNHLDGCKAIRRVWKRDGESLLEYIEIEGGGHTVPGAKYPERQAAWLERVFGKTCLEFQAVEELVAFFGSH